ncbi:MAG: hypothetical protein JSW65_01535 [Candidatus Bipolaricaulota bacterium]|nr:MAG: hypothetical protein JSW65_01535 [Candidatus Bipolaricaulota bacterium]
MRILACRWGIVTAILGVPLLGRGLSAASGLWTTLGIGLLLGGACLFLLGRLAHPRV